MASRNPATSRSHRSGRPLARASSVTVCPAGADRARAALVGLQEDVVLRLRALRIWAGSSPSLGTISSGGQPTKHFTTTARLVQAPTARLADRSSWAGHLAVQPSPERLASGS